MIPVVIDTETTGVDHNVDRIVEIAAVWDDPEDGRLDFDAMCDPGKPIPPEASAIHHIVDEDVKFSDLPEDVVAQLILSIGHEDQIVFVAHNAKFDANMLGVMFPELLQKTWICTWRCALHLWSDAPGHSNQALRYWLKLSPVLPEGLFPHRALYDVIVTRAILDKMLETKSLEELVELSNTPVLLTTVRFGKHKGRRWQDVPRDYLQWLSRQVDMDEDVRHTARYWMVR